MFAFVQGHIVCTEEGLPGEAFMESVKSLLPAIEGMLAGTLSRIQQGDYRGDEATIEAWSVGPREMIAWCKERGVPDGMARVQQELFERATKVGRGQADFAYVYELMRPAPVAGAAPRDM
jgi:hypothetical protein